ncbi:MAG: hypothetical protein GOMPHAMPRED_008178 [Gomphillus americanus]|uniref:Uncharacterized protein n=1 Tax=Gomphillus americanus TaxID=1940652 RepID=A0A8H3F1Z5_9LECA|nr:MAG: hypothetical protein GOMPHAMPRED_008178 [Gomphillus americanus]
MGVVLQPEALADEDKDLPWAEDIEDGLDVSLIASWRDHLDAMDVVQGHAVLAICKLKAKTDVYEVNTLE